MKKHFETPTPPAKKEQPGSTKFADQSGKPSSSEDSLSKQLLHPEKSQVPGEPLGRDSKGG